MLELRRHKPAGFTYDGLRFRNLTKLAKAKGMNNVSAYSSSEIAQACSVFYAKLKLGAIEHAGDPLMTEQLPGCMAKTRGNNFIVERVPGASEIDSVYATIIGVYGAETIKKKSVTIH